MAVAIMCLLLVPHVAGERERIQCYTDFDDRTPTNIDDETTYYGSASPSVHIADGGWGLAKMKDFAEVTITMWVYCYDVNNEFDVIVDNMENGDDLVTFRFHAPNKQEISLQVMDKYNTIYNEEQVWYTEDAIENNITLEVSISYTEEKIDGVSKYAKVKIQNEHVLTVNLYSAELENADNPEREWNRITFKAQGDQDVAIDDIYIRTSPAKMSGLNLTFLLITFAVIVAVVVMIASGKNENKRKKGRSMKGR